MGWMKYYQMKEKESFSNEKVSFLNENLVAKMYSAARSSGTGCPTSPEQNRVDTAILIPD